MNKKDLRVIKTKKNLARALIYLLKNKELDRIQIIDICSEAACSRNTFYSHYYSKYELFNDIVNECVEKICETFSVEHYNAEFVKQHGYGTEIIQVAHQYREELTVLLESGYAGELKKRLSRGLYELEKNSYLKKYKAEIIPTDISLSYHYQVGGVVEFVCNWIVNGAFMDAEAASKLHARINTPVANAINELQGYALDMYVI